MKVELLNLTPNETKLVVIQIADQFEENKRKTTNLELLSFSKEPGQYRAHISYEDESGVPRCHSVFCQLKDDKFEALVVNFWNRK